MHRVPCRRILHRIECGLVYELWRREHHKYRHTYWREYLRFVRCREILDCFERAIVLDVCCWAARCKCWYYELR